MFNIKQLEYFKAFRLGRVICVNEIQQLPFKNDYCRFFYYFKVQICSWYRHLRTYFQIPARVSTQHLCSLIIIEFYLSEYNVYYLDSEKYVYCRGSITVMYLGGCRRGGCRLFTAVAAPAHARSSSIAVLLSPLEPLRVQFVPNMLCIIN